MAYKSLLLSLALTTILGYCFTVGLTSPNSLLKKMPEWAAFPILAAMFLLYLLAAWWGIKGFGAHKISAVFSLLLCTFGIGVYLLVAVMELGKGKAMPGQFDYNFERLDADEAAALSQIVQNAGLTLNNATFTEFWHLSEPAPGFCVCVQKGHITGLHFSGKNIPDLAPFSRFPQLGALYLNACGLTDMSALSCPNLDRLELSDNNISNLKSLNGCSNVRWLTLRNNQLHSTEGIELFTKLVSQDLTGNPI